MLPSPRLPASWQVLLETFRPVFARTSTFVLFTILATGLVARTHRRTVVGMLAGAHLGAVVSFHAACRFFSHAVWDVDRLGLTVARLIVTGLLPADAPIVVVIDDTLFRRWGRRVHHAFWTHDGAAQGRTKTGRGNRWVIAGLIIRLPWCSHPVCLPVLFRLWAGKGTTSPVELAADLLTLLAHQFAGRQVHMVGDGAYHGTALLEAGATITTRLPTNAALYDLAPPRTGKRGRPRLKGPHLGHLTQIATTATWTTVAVERYGKTETIGVAEVPAIWYGAFANTPGRLVLATDPSQGRSAKPYGLAVFTTDTTTPAAGIIARYADRWTIETAIATGKQTLGVGQARNRLPLAVERTVPFGFIVQSLVTVWYATSGHHPDDLTPRRTAEPWYTRKTEPAFEDMLAKLRRTLIAARYTPTSTDQPDPDIIRDYALACAAAAA